MAPVPGGRVPCGRAAKPVSHPAMTRVFDICDRTRLRERFFGASHTVLARR
ncbi:hypothetical protein RISW2_17600 [Roseivivax isoporae LMG 25204]|uniref:Uncharacterized protein n=1 Tax=Roseivivax isoporae LMG 25204 TaxID=1449351 RepID=X7F2B7_9RHOB|nr:hypothetical protein RISW2_17600 [Roseivivax isoporae LMG 25204]